MNETKIDWADATWNPVTGCLHGCEYCYARRMTRRFGSVTTDSNLHVMDHPYRDIDIEPLHGTEVQGAINPYPHGFAPTFHRHLLEQPASWKEPRTIFVCSMADLFGAWVPDEWIREVIQVCEAAPWHKHLFLTKNPGRYIDLSDKGILPESDNFWYGTSAPTQGSEIFWSEDKNTFVSIEPIMGDFSENCSVDQLKWVIVGAETGNRKGKVVPERAWVEHLAKACENNGIPIFMKGSLRELMGSDFKQEFPWEVTA